jgi:hypothetical protein
MAAMAEKAPPPPPENKKATQGGSVCLAGARLTGRRRIPGRTQVRNTLLNPLGYFLFLHDCAGSMPEFRDGCVTLRKFRRRGQSVSIRSTVTPTSRTWPPPP